MTLRPAISPAFRVASFSSRPKYAGDGNHDVGRLLPGCLLGLAEQRPKDDR